MMTSKYVNIGIVTFNRLDFTKQAIASIIKHTTHPHIITIVDNGSTDGTQEYLRELQEIKIVKNVVLLENNIGVAKASNLAWKQEPEADYYLKYDNDIVIEKNNWLSNLVSVIDAVPSIGVIGYNFEQNSYPIRYFGNYQVRIKEKGNIGGACFLIPKRTHRILGYWCEDYGLYGFEDCDYSFRVSLSGLLNAYMEDENIGIHLPAGKAPIVNGITWQSTDGIEELKYQKYRVFKDSQMKSTAESGILSQKFDDYINKKCSLYTSSTEFKLPIKSFSTQMSTSSYSKKNKLLRVDLGCGENKDSDFCGVDVCPGPNVDIVADLNQKFPFEDNSVDEIKAHDSIEHLHDRLHTMNEIWRICKDGALVDIRVPSTDGRGAFQDPTHVSFWNINSFMYYCVEFPAYLQLCKRYGFKGEFKILHLDSEESENQVIHVIAKLQVVKPYLNSNSRNLNIETSFASVPTNGNSELSQYTSGKNSFDEESINKLLDELNTQIIEYQKQPNSQRIIANIRHLRTRLSDKCLDVLDSDIPSFYADYFKKIYENIINIEIIDTEITSSEKYFLDNILLNISKGLNQPRAIQNLLTGMLYYSSSKLPLKHDLIHIPDWFLPDYIKFLFSNPVYFMERGSANNYYEHLKNWVDYLHASIVNNLEDPFWRNVASYFVKFANFIPVYFNENNLKDIYVKRAEIIDLYLRSNGYQIDYEFSRPTTNRKKIRVGILASHFTPSAETFASLPLYEYLSREFEVILYSLRQTNHPLEQYCRLSANYFIKLPQDLSEQVNLIRADDLDILFVATNVTAVTNQICLLATHRLARVQMTSGGSVVTTGIAHMDYFLSGTLTDPAIIAQDQYSEKLIRIPGSAHCFSYGDDETKSTFKVDSLEDKLRQKEMLGIPRDAVVFASGANFFKISPELMHAWAKIIFEVPNSILMLFPFGPNWSNSYPKRTFECHLHQVFKQYGVSPDRVLALDPQPIPNREDIKEYFKLADVYLDSYPFAGTTSLIEPLQVNLPVVASSGNNFRSAMGAAIVQSLDIESLVANSEESYVRLAIELGKNTELRKQKIDEIKSKIQNNPAFLDSRAYSSKIGNLFRELFDQYKQETLIHDLCLRDINLIIFPDWSADEELLGEELSEIFYQLAQHPDVSQMTLIIDTTGVPDVESANALISAIVMNIMMSEDIDITESLTISLTGELAPIQWTELLPKLQGRIKLELENLPVIDLSHPHLIPEYQLSEIIELAVV